MTRLGIFAVVLLAVERFPSPALKAKHPSSRVIPEHRRQKGTRADPVCCRLTTEPSGLLRCSLCDPLSTTSPSTREPDAPSSAFFRRDRSLSLRTLSTRPLASEFYRDTSYSFSTPCHPYTLRRKLAYQVGTLCDLIVFSSIFSVP